MPYFIYKKCLHCKHTDTELIEVRKLLEERRDLLKYNDRDKTKRTVRTFNVDGDLLTKLEAYAKAHKISASDAINIMLARSFN